MPIFITHNLNYRKRDIMKSIIITIGREYGSGGRYIGELVSKRLNIPFYDKNLITKTYEKNNCDYSKLEEYDEVSNSGILKKLEMFDINNYKGNGIYSSDVYQNLVSDTIKDISKHGSCVILGRNSNNILKDRDNVINIFIYSNDLDFKIKRKMELENISYDEALSRLKYVDKNRRKYYESMNKNKSWGNIRDYDYLIDSSILGVDGTADMIVYIYNKYKDSNIK